MKLFSKMLAAWFAVLATSSPASAWTLEDLKQDFFELGRLADKDFWLGARDSEDEMDTHLTIGAAKFVDGGLLAALGGGLVAHGVLREFGRRAYPEMPMDDAASRYLAHLRYEFRRKLMTHVPKTSKLYAKLEAATAAGESPWISTQSFGIPAWWEHRLTNRLLFIGGGSVVLASALLYLVAVDESGGLPLDEVSATDGSPLALATQVHALAEALPAK